MPFVNILLGLCGLSLLVLLHELGHYLAARLCSVRVLVFSIGIGPRIWGITRGDTEFRLSAIPLGGYCRMDGEHDINAVLEGKKARIEASPGSFYHTRPWQRILISAAGPLTNLVFALLVMSIIWGLGFSYRSTPPRVGLVSTIEAGTSHPADAAGLTEGDLVLRADAKDIQSWAELTAIIASNALNPIEIEVQRPASRGKLTLVPAMQPNGAGFAGIYNLVTPKIMFTGPQAWKDGLRPGDQILSVNRQPCASTWETMNLVSQHSGSVLEIGVLRQGVELRLPWHFDPDRPGSAVIFQDRLYRHPALTPWHALAKGWQETTASLVLTVRGLGLMFRGLSPDQALTGPLRLIPMIGDVGTRAFAQGLEVGLRNWFEILAMISIALFFGNLLPIPALDGGQILMFVWEMIRRRPVGARGLQLYQTIGSLCILALFVFVFFIDIKNILGG